MKTTRTFLLMLLMLTSVLVATAVCDEDDDELREMIAQGKILHEKSCVTACHGNEMYSRKNLFVKDFTQLESQVKACAVRNKVGWDSDQLDNVIEYLASTFYHYE